MTDLHAAIMNLRPPKGIAFDYQTGFKDACHAAAELASAALSVPAWMPIESAPKDRLVDILSNGRRYAGCHYDRICDEYRHITACGVLIRLKQATHWMPLPEPPAVPQPQEPTCPKN